jgi:GNAT superfamily N-acetyltransferase
MASPTSVSTPPCTLLDWDSRFFGFRIGRVTSERLTPENVSSVLSWCEQEEIKCLYFLANSDDAGTVRLAEGCGFHLVDIRITLRRSLTGDGDFGGTQLAGGVRFATAADIPALRAIAAKSHHDTRFYTDTGFPPALADELYATWIEKSCQGMADVVLVVTDGDRSAGYATCQLEVGGCGRIGLMAVDGEARGHGMGSALIDGAISWFTGEDVHTVTVVTQGKNAAAQRLYQRSGFLTHSLQLWYHRWFPER